jgi:A/G-specific adenine glycosylase
VHVDFTFALLGVFAKAEKHEISIKKSAIRMSAVYCCLSNQTRHASFLDQMDLRGPKSNLLNWYAQNKRALPWRADRDPYRIWISETMLQQTTTTAVIPYFERFVTRFPNLESLATAAPEAVLEMWAGLGYYSRARNLHKSAQALHRAGGFPRDHKSLMEFPGFGPYTARAVSSLAFDESVGVVDGNVIRVLSRFYGLAWEWWKNKTRDQIQELVDKWVAQVSSYEMNQALMELGRTVCTPKVAVCMMCPLRTDCTALKMDLITSLPKPKPRRERELWVWEPQIVTKKGRLLLTQNTTVPFAKGHWVLPGTARKVKRKPVRFDYKHTITHHDIYVTLRPNGATPKEKILWVDLKEIRKYAPTSLVQKALDASPVGGSIALRLQNKRKS